MTQYYHATGSIVRGLLAQENHLVTRVKSNSVAFFPATPPPTNRPRRKGRPAKYGKKIKVAAPLKEAARLGASALTRSDPVTLG